MMVALRPESATVYVMLDADKKKLAKLQTAVARGNIAMLERNAMFRRLFSDGITHSAMTLVVNEVNAAEGDREVTADAVYRAIKRLNDKNEINH
jgi:hypothetical protein